MGFGTLFIGYFLLLNITYFQFYSDLISALVMLMGLVKLSKFNREFSAATAMCTVFALISLVEFGEVIYEIFVPGFDSQHLVATLSVARYAVLGVMTVLIMLGIKSLANEVDHKPLELRARTSVYFSGAIYFLALLTELPTLSAILPQKIWVYGGFAIQISFIVIVASVLRTIYSAYMSICMPEDLDMTPKKSRFKFVNEMREREDELVREYKQEQLEKIKKKAEKRKNKKK